VRLETGGISRDRRLELDAGRGRSAGALVSRAQAVVSRGKARFPRQRGTQTVDGAVDLAERQQRVTEAAVHRRLRVIDRERRAQSGHGFHVLSLP